MLYRKFADTDIKLSVLGFGTAGIGLNNYLKEFNSIQLQEESISALEKAIELGINYFDSAPAYGNKTPGAEWPTDRMAETLLGKVIENNMQKRTQLFIATKNQIGQYEKGEIRRSLEKSLDLLKTDYIDLFQVHGANYRESQYVNMMSEEAEKEILKLKEEGLVKYLGISGYREGGLLAAVDRGIYDAIMAQYNIFYRSAEWELLDVLKEKKMAFLPMRPVTAEKIVSFINEIDPENKLNINPYHVAMKYVLMNDAVTSIPVGMRTASEVEENIAYIDSLKEVISHE